MTYQGQYSILFYLELHFITFLYITEKYESVSGIYDIRAFLSKFSLSLRIRVIWASTKIIIMWVWSCRLTLVLLNPDISCLCKQCRSRSVAFFRQQRFWSDGADSEADLCLRWAHMSSCRFCRALAHFCFSRYCMFHRVPSSCSSTDVCSGFLCFQILRPS